MLYLFNVTIKRCNNLFFALKLSFYQFQIVDKNVFSFHIVFEILNFILKLSYIFILLGGSSLYNFIFVLL
jgi:hypothetical protein